MTAAGSRSYRVTFDRSDILPLAQEIMQAADDSELAEKIYLRIRPHLGACDFQVAVDLEAMRGAVLFGWRPSVIFTIVELSHRQCGESS